MVRWGSVGLRLGEVGSPSWTPGTASTGPSLWCAAQLFESKGAARPFLNLDPPKLAVGQNQWYPIFGVFGEFTTRFSL